MSTAASRIPYAEKLRDPRWQRRRLEIMERDKFACRHCGDTEKTLNVHHCIYEKGKAPWDYEDRKLVTLCEDCHKGEELRKRLISISAGNNHGVSIALITTAWILEEDGPWSHPVFSCLLHNILAVCRGYEGIESSKGEGAAYDAIAEQETVLAKNALQAVSCLMEIRCMVNSTVETKAVEEGI